MAGDRVRRAAREYDDLLWSEHLTSTIDGLGGQSGGLTRRTALRPVLITEADLRRHAGVARAVARGLEIAVRILIAQPALRRRIGLPDYLDALIDLEPAGAPGSAFARLDGIVSGGALRVIEYNAEPGAIHHITRLTAAFESLPVTRAFRERHPCQSIAPARLLSEALREDSVSRGGPARPRVVIVRNVGSEGAAAPKPAAQMFGPLAFEHVESASAGELDYRRERLEFRDRPVDVILLQAWMDVIASPDTCAPLLAAIRAGHVRVAGGLSKGILCSYKHVFELLSDPAHAGLFPVEVGETLAAHVPWTRVVRDCRTTYDGETVALCEFVERHRERFLIKPGGGRGGAGVVPGWRTDAVTWSRHLARGINRCVVQERVRPESSPYPVWVAGEARTIDLHGDYCPYLLNVTGMDGCAIRLSDSDLHSASFGGMNTPVWVLS
ncbi:MAG TPA: hypothetical protein VN700_17320 [Vicinamibacterales bacterium]|nr:hypothetical protein [Vicinamibacterales bacterium]